MGSSPTVATMDDELEELKLQFIQHLLDNGWYYTSIRYIGLESEATDDVTMVGNSKVWE